MPDVRRYRPTDAAACCVVINAAIALEFEARRRRMR